MEGVMCQRQSDLQEKWQRAAENREYVRRLLTEKQPAFAAALRAAERRLDWELSLSSLTAASVYAASAGKTRFGAEDGSWLVRADNCGVDTSGNRVVLAYDVLRACTAGGY
jgi:hypothetical protein